jgi:hypothetical protein
VEHLFPSAQRSLPHLDGAFGDDEEAVARLALLEQELTPAEPAIAAPGSQPSTFSVREGAKVRDLPEELYIIRRGSGPCHRAPRRL